MTIPHLGKYVGLPLSQFIRIRTENGLKERETGKVLYVRRVQTN